MWKRRDSRGVFVTIKLGGTTAGKDWIVDFLTNPLSITAAVMFLIGSLPFMWMIWNKKVAPARSTWILYVVLDFLGGYAMHLRDSLNGQIAMATTTALITMLLTIFRSGTGGGTRLDRWCFFLAGIGGTLLVTTTEEVALFAGCVAGAIATWPSFCVAWHTREKESRWAWTWFLLSGIPTFLSLHTITFMNAAQPAQFAGIQSLMCLLLWTRIRPQWLAWIFPEPDTAP